MATRIAVVLDESGSMQRIAQATVDGFNEYVQDLQKDDSDEATLTLTKFGQSAEVVLSNAPINSVLDLVLHRNYSPSGGTALYDAISYAVRELSRTVSNGDKALVVVLTDGHENSSRETTKDQIISLINAKEAEGNWTFAYLGAGQDAWTAGTGLGIAGGNTFSYAATADSTHDTYSRLSASTGSLRGQSMASSTSFLADDPETKDDAI